MFSEIQAKKALLDFAKIDKPRAKLLEKMMRLETAHFTSKQFLLTGSAGMESGAWGSTVNKYFPNGYNTIPMNDNNPKLRGKTQVSFIVWDDIFDFLEFLSDYIDRHNGDYARWNSTNLARKTLYKLKVNSVKNRFVL